MSMYKTSIIKNFLSDNQLSTIRDLVNSYEQTASDIVEAPIGRYLGVSTELDILLNGLIEKLPNEILFIKILDATIPGGPHSDTYLPPNPVTIPKFARTFIIPFEDTNTNTVLFNEALPIGEDMFHHINNVLAKATSSIITEEIHSKYLTHCSLEMCEKLSLDVIFPWIAGDMLIFDRTKLHCSDNYVVNNLENKKGFVIWSEIVETELC